MVRIRSEDGDWVVHASYLIDSNGLETLARNLATREGRDLPDVDLEVLAEALIADLMRPTGDGTSAAIPHAHGQRSLDVGEG